MFCYHAEIIASGLGWPDPILLHCTHCTKTRQGLNPRTDKFLVSVLFTIKKMGQVKIGQDGAALCKDGEISFLLLSNAISEVGGKPCF